MTSLLFFAWAGSALAQKPVFSIGMNAHYGSIFAHSVEVANTSGAHPVGLSADLVWQRVDERTWNTCSCYPRMGVSAAYFNYDHPVLGHSASASYFLEPSFRVFRNFQLALRGTVGLAWLSNPYDAASNPTNLSYSLPVNGLLGIGAGSYIRLSKRFQLSVSASFFHISNGAIREPNKGIDWPSAGLGLLWNVSQAELPDRPRTKPDLKGKKPRVDVFTFASGRTAVPGENTYYPVYGAGLNISRQISRLNAIAAGAEWHKDLALQEVLKRERRTHLTPDFAGLMIGNEFLLGRFVFSQHIGVYVYRDVPDFILMYHRWGLFYRITSHFGAGINFKAHAHHAHFLDARLVFSF